MVFEYITKTEAQEKSGIKKLDGRRKYFIWEGEVCIDKKYTHPCSGCACNCCHTRGAGCFECGFTGKRVGSVPVPIKYLNTNQGE